jgi:hypothetical protein
MKNAWIDQYSGENYRITTTGHHADRHTARVKTYGDVLREYAIHPESKCAYASGKPCSKQTVGLVQRRHVRIGERLHGIRRPPTRRMTIEDSACIEEDTRVHSSENGWQIAQHDLRDVGRSQQTTSQEPGETCCNSRENSMPSNDCTDPRGPTRPHPCPRLWQPGVTPEHQSGPLP